MSSLREVDRWRAGSFDNPIMYRVMEDEETGIRHLEVKSRWDEDFRTPTRGHGTELASRLMELFEMDEKVVSFSSVDWVISDEEEERKYA